MKIGILIAAVMWLGVSATISGCSDSASPRGISIQGGRGIIVSSLPRDAERVLGVSQIEGSWTPSAVQADNADRAIVAFLGAAVNVSPPGVERSRLERMLVHIGDYERQYYGIVSNGRKYMRCIFAEADATSCRSNLEPLNIHDGQGFAFSYEPCASSIIDLFMTSPP